MNKLIATTAWSKALKVWSSRAWRARCIGRRFLVLDVTALLIYQQYALHLTNRDTDQSLYMHIPSITGHIVMVQTLQFHNLSCSSGTRYVGRIWRAIRLEIIYPERRLAQAPPWIMLCFPCFTTKNGFASISSRKLLMKIAVKV